LTKRTFLNFGKRNGLERQVPGGMFRVIIDVACESGFGRINNGAKVLPTYTPFIAADGGNFAVVAA
jgi:hypothetical protein